jgi:hypothetical protein
MCYCAAVVLVEAFYRYLPGRPEENQVICARIVGVSRL